MSLLSSAFSAFSVSADSFAVAISKGVIATKKPSLNDSLKLGLFFGLVELTALALGFTIGIWFKGWLHLVDHWVALMLLGLLGGKMFLSANDAQESASQHDVVKTTSDQKKSRFASFALVLSTSVDSIVFGVSSAFFSAHHIVIASMLFLSTVLLVSIGNYAGHRIGLRAGYHAERLAGLILMFVGIKIFTEHVFF